MIQQKRQDVMNVSGWLVSGASVQTMAGVSLTAGLCLSPSGASASELVLQCTPEGIRLQCYMNYYTEEMKTVWKHKYAHIKCFTWLHITREHDSNIYFLYKPAIVSLRTCPRGAGRYRSRGN